MEEIAKHDPRHEARRVALATLFEQAFHSSETKKSIARILELYEEREVDRELLDYIVAGVTKRREELDNLISETAPTWPPEQINRIDLVILRIAIWELLFSKDILPKERQIPPKVAIDEAVEIAKEFGGTSSGSFVNGVLGTVVENHLEGEEKPDREKNA